jgi:hypothetical protein
MGQAAKLARTRMIVAMAGVALPFVVGPLVHIVGAGSVVTAIVGGIALLAGAGLFFWMLFVWRPRCPQCGVASAARFVREGDNQHLRCTRCAYDEPTGWTYGD